MKMLQLLRKLELEAADAAWEARRQAALKFQDLTSADALYAADRRKLKSLQASIASVKKQLDVRRQVEAEHQRMATATLALQEEWMSSEKRKTRDAEIDRMRRVFSRVCREASPDWKADADRDFKSRYAPQKKT
jgi:hypothetical protein